MNIAIVGATGKVGQKFIEVLEERCIKADNFYLYASSKSKGKKLKVFDCDIEVLELSEENIKNKKIDYALFSAGGTISKKFAPSFVRYGAIVIDNSSAFRRDKSVPLVVVEANKEAILLNRGIIANPNCSTIGLVLPLKVLNDKYGVKRVVVSTYQAVSGAGQKGCDDLKNGINGLKPQKFIYPIFNNLIPHIDVFVKGDYTKEEDKMIFETNKILHTNIAITATAVRVPVENVHCLSVNVQLKKAFKTSSVKKQLSLAKNIIVLDNPSKNLYPMPIFANEKDEVFVGRIRRDYSETNALNFWVASDNIRKGAATNAIQILQALIDYKNKGEI